MRKQLDELGAKFNVHGHSEVADVSMTLKREVRRRLWSLGYDLARFNPESHPIARRRRLMSSWRIDVVLDVGANAGQFAHHLRSDLGFEGRICSFEPLSVPFRRLQSLVGEDPNWQAFNFALGDVEGMATINVAANSESSSMLEMLPLHMEAAPESRFVGTEDVEIRMLDAIFHNLCHPGEGVYLKIDAQGFEGRVLRGADRCLPKIDTVQVEMSLTPLYSDELTFGALYQLLLGKGYVMVGLEPRTALRDPTPLRTKGGARLDQREQADPCVEMLMKEGDANPGGRLNENRRKRQATQDRPAVDDRPQHDGKLSVQKV